MYANQKHQASTAIDSDVLERIIDAILDGKYSYACLMTLEATGYDPLQYIPYRTYNRLQKQRQAICRTAHQRTVHQTTVSKVSSIGAKISDIEHVDSLSNRDRRIEGGSSLGSRFGGDNILYWPY